MPIKVPDMLPAKDILRKENIFVMDESRAFRQDIRPLKIAVLNLMPLKQTTETQLLRLLGNSPLQIDVTLLRVATHTPKNTPPAYLRAFYKVFGNVRHERFDGMIITGSPLEAIPYEEVNYWQELCEIMEWTRTNVYSTFHICWGALAALYYHYGIDKQLLSAKLFGVFPHFKTAPPESPNAKLLMGFDGQFFIPHSRWATIAREDVLALSELEILAESAEAGISLMADKNGKAIFAMGHSEYDANTLKTEYERDLTKNINIDAPKNYFDQNGNVNLTWRAHGNLLFSNWLNYFVYQETPFDFIEYCDYSI